ncbi:MAG: short-chain dehydrogenase, partial [Acidobacteriota bacterium]
AMTADQGALPTLRAAVAPDAEGADYYGPDGWMEMRGWPVKVGRSKEAASAEQASKLWELSSELTDLRYLEAA